MTQQITEILTPVVLALIMALVSIAIVAINMGRDTVITWIKSKTTADQQAVINSVAHEAHAHAEKWAKTYAGDKLQTAVEYAVGELIKRGIKVDSDKILAAIQSAWQQYNPNK